MKQVVIKSYSFASRRGTLWLVSLMEKVCKLHLHMRTAEDELLCSLVDSLEVYVNLDGDQKAKS